MAAQKHTKKFGLTCGFTVNVTALKASFAVKYASFDSSLCPAVVDKLSNLTEYSLKKTAGISTDYCL